MERVAAAARAFRVQTILPRGSQTGFFSALTWRVPPDRNVSEFLAQYGQVGWLYAITSKISDSVAQVPWKIVQVQPDGDRVEVGPEHPAVMMLKTVNTHWTTYDLLQMTQLYLDLAGEAFWFILRDRVGRPRMIWTLPPIRMQVLPSDDVTQFVRGYVYITPIGQQIPIDPADIVMFRLPNPLNVYRGLGPVQAASLTVDSALFAAQYTRNFYFNNAAPGGIIKVPGGWNEAEFERLKAQWEQRHQGAENAGKVAVLWGEMEWTAADISARDMQLIEQRKMTRDELLGVFGMPLSVMGITENVNRANAEAGYYVYAREVISSRLHRVASTINKLFLPQFGKNLEMEFAHIIPDDTQAIMVKAISGFGAGLVTMNEGREMLGLDAVVDGEWVLLPEDDANIDQFDSEKAEEDDLDSFSGDDAAKRDAAASESSAATGGALIGPKKRKRGRRLWVKRITAASVREEKRKNEPMIEIELPDTWGGESRSSELFEQRGLAHWTALQPHLRAIEDDAQREIAQEFDRFWEDVARHLSAMLSVPEMRDTDGYESRTVEDSLADWTSHDGRLTVIIKRSVERAFAQGAKNGAASIGPAAAGRFDLRRLPSEQWAAAKAGALVKGIGQTTRGQLRGVVEGGLRDGKNVRQIAEDIQRTMKGASDARAATIARTEVQQAANQGARHQYIVEHIEQMQWWTSMDERVCPQCEDLNGEIVGVEEVFSDGSDTPPAHANCRCTILPVVDGGGEESAPGIVERGIVTLVDVINDIAATTQSRQEVLDRGGEPIRDDHGKFAGSIGTGKQRTSGLPSRKWEEPPKPKARGGRPGGVSASGKTNTFIGDMGEKLLEHYGIQNLHPGTRIGHLDRGIGKYAFEVKTSTTDSSVYRAAMDPSEVKEKIEYARSIGRKPGMMLNVMDVKSRTTWTYWKEGIGNYRLTNPKNGWHFAGKVKF